MPPSEPHSRLIFAASLLIAAVAWLVLSAPWLFGSLTIPYDAKAHFHPQLQFLAHALHSGQSPFWTPHIFAGSPQVADPQSLIFSPAILLALVSPVANLKALDYYALALVGGAGLAAMFIFRDRGWHPIGGLVAGLGIAFGASAAWRIQHIGQIQSYALFVIALWALCRTVDRRSVPWGIVAGVAAGLMLAEPDQVAFLAALMLSGYVVAQLATRGSYVSTIQEHAPALLAIAFTTLLIALVPVTLTYLFALSSSRSEIPFAEVIRGSLHPASLLTGVIGDLYGALDQNVHYWGPYSRSWDPNEITLSQNMSQIYVGALPPFLLLTVGCSRGWAWHKDIRYFSIALIMLLLYAVGGYTPVFRLLYEVIPGVSLFRRPADATFLIGSCLALIGGYLVHRLINDTNSRTDWRQHAWDAGIIALIFASGVGVAVSAGHLNNAVRPLLIAAGLITAAAIVVQLIRTNAKARPMMCLAVAGGFTIADLAANNGPNQSTALPLRHYNMMQADTDDEVIRFLKTHTEFKEGSNRRDRVELVGLGFSWPNLGLVHGFDHTLGYNPLRLAAVTDVIGASDTIAGWDQRKFTPLFPSYDSPLANMLGLRYIVTPVPIARIDKHGGSSSQLTLRHRTPRAFIYENSEALPRALLVHNWKVTDFDQLTRSGSWPTFDPMHTVLLNAKPNPVATPRQQRHGATRPNHHAVSITKYENTVIEIAVTAKRPGFVVLNDIWHPWWRASVNGQPAPILKANVLFRAVAVDAGSHKVRFEFAPFAGALGEIWSGPKSRRR